jgi:tetratricopeptide (TPR) repeat protein
LEGEVGVLYERALAAQEELRTEDALALLLQVEKVAPDNAKVLQKIARQYSDSTIDTSDDARQNLLLERALDYSQKATEIDPTDPVNMLSLAVVKGKIATLLGNKAKVEAARIIKADARRAIELDPTYAWAHHVLGRWHREVDELGSIARFFTKILYGGLPEASIEEAVFHLGKATELEPENLNHFLELGFAYRAAGEEEKARTNFERGLSMPIKEKHDEAAKTRARRALQQLG